MSYLLDTHVMIWLASDHPNLSKKFKTAFANEKHLFFISVVSIWEMAIKISLGKLILPVSLDEFVRSEIYDNGIQILSVKPEHIFNLLNLPFHHRDPFDRMLIAQVSYEKMLMVTKDAQFEKYKIKLMTP